MNKVRHWWRRTSKADILGYALMIVCPAILTFLGARGGFVFGMAKGGIIGALIGLLIGAVGGVIAGFLLWLAVCSMIVIVGVIFLWFVPRK